MLDGKVAVITGATSGMALAGAKLFVDEGAHVFISGRRKDALNDAVKLIGQNVTGVQGDSADLDDLDRLFETVKQEKGAVDVLWASAGVGEQGRLGGITKEQFDAAFSLSARGTLFTVQKALPLFNDGGSIFMTGSNASLRGYPDWSVYAASKAVLPACARVWVSELMGSCLTRAEEMPLASGSPPPLAAFCLDSPPWGGRTLDGSRCPARRRGSTRRERSQNWQ
jgi:NAD(P)-dependent dehydrogenase (short-subunit alcohol dehydrogenase family)